MLPNKLTYATVGGIFALVALTVDQVLWLRFPLYFGPGILIAFLSPFIAAGVGGGVGWWAMKKDEQNVGLAIIVTNLLAATLGIWWALSFQPQAFGGPGISPAFISALKRLFIVQ